MPYHSDPEKMIAVNKPMRSDVARDMDIIEFYLKNHCEVPIQAKQLPQVKNGTWTGHYAGNLLARMVRLGLPIRVEGTENGGSLYAWRSKETII
jgi:hypothetical protein